MADQLVPELPDVDIALMMMEGNEEGLRALLRKYGGKVRGALRRRFGTVLDEDQLDEALNLAALRAWRFAHRYDDKLASLGVWFWSVTRNVAKNILREELRWNHGELEFDPEYDPAEWAADDGEEEAPAENEARQKKLLADFHTVVGALPPLQKAIIEADLAAGGPAGAAALAAKHGTTKASIYVSRNKARATIAKEMVRLGHYQDEPKTQR